MSGHCEEEPKEKGKYAIFSPESIQMIGEMSGFENLTQDIVLSLSGNATYRLQEIIEECALYLRNSKTSYLTTNIINEIFVEKKIPKVYGYDEYLDDIPMQIIPSAEIYSETDKILNINSLLGCYDEKFDEEIVTQPPEDSNLFHPDLQFYKFENDDDSDDYETGLHSNYIFPLNELTDIQEVNKEFYEIITRIVYEASEELLLDILNNFIKHREFGFLGNQFLNFIIEGLVKYPFSKDITPRLLIFLECILMNKSFQMHEILILHLIKRVSENLLSDEVNEIDDEEIRDRYVEILHMIIPRVDQRLETLSLITKEITEIFPKSEQFSRKIFYGALSFLTYLPPDMIHKTIEPYFASIFKKVTENDLKMRKVCFKLFHKISAQINTNLFYYEFGDSLLPWDMSIKRSYDIILIVRKLKRYLNDENSKIKIKHLHKGKNKKFSCIVKNFKIAPDKKNIANYSLNFFL